ncbi:MAG: cell division protein ZapA [Methylobacteriaceae bacterium]|jgi:cell division protein ZapA|nr:cell division protein ZapA [Methylobacteriaceae bacterium]
MTAESHLSITITVAGREYRVACGPGEEFHLRRLAAMLDGRINELRGALGEIGDMRLQVMAALTIADELDDYRRRITDLEETVATLEAKLLEEGAKGAGYSNALAATIDRAAETIEQLALELNARNEGV